MESLKFNQISKLNFKQYVVTMMKKDNNLMRKAMGKTCTKIGAILAVALLPV